MKATMDAAQFSQALNKAVKSTGRSRYIDLDQIRVDVGSGLCRLTATNLEQFLTAELPAEGEAFSFKFCNTQAVLKASKYFDGPLSLDYDQEHGELMMECPPRSSRISVDTVDKFPELPAPKPAEAVYHTNTHTLCRRFDRVKYAAAAPGCTRKALCGIRFDGKRLAAVDGYRMAVNTDDAMDVKKPFILPLEAMKLLPLFGDAEAAIEVGEKWCTIRSGGLRLTTRMLDDDHFNIDGVIPTTFIDTYDANVKQFVSELKYLEALLPKKAAEPIKFSGGTLSTFTPNGEHQSAISLSAPATVIYGFDVRYMLDGLNQFKDAETVTIRTSSPKSPIILTNGGADLALVLPVKLAKYEQAA